MLRGLLTVFLLALAGTVLLPWQASLQRREKAAGFRTAPLDLGLREQVGQAGFLAALSGFRSPLAALLWIDAHTAWEKTEWGRMAGIFDTVTTLQPHTLLYWDIAAWHMAWNASAAALQDTKQKSEALRERARQQYIALGRDYLERGIRNNPSSPLLYERLGILLRDKTGDHAGAADAFAKGASLPGAPAYLSRFAAYESAKVPGREHEAYDRLLGLYNQDVKMRVPALVTHLQKLERQLGIPDHRRNGAPAPPPSPGPAPSR